MMLCFRLFKTRCLRVLLSILASFVLYASFRRLRLVVHHGESGGHGTSGRWWNISPWQDETLLMPWNSSMWFKSRTSMMCAKMPLAGRLGNHMFVYAATIGVAHSQNYTPVIDKSSAVLKSMFHITTNQRPEGNIRWTEFKEQHAHAYDKRVLDLRADKNHILKGYYQSWKYFNDPKIQDFIRKEFRFNDEIMSIARQYIVNVTEHYKDQLQIGPNHNDSSHNETGSGTKKTGSTKVRTSTKQLKLVGVHVRRGDLPESYNSQKGYIMAPVSYIHKAMRYFEIKYSSYDLMFIICSDTIEWVEKNVHSQKSPIVLSRIKNGAVDLAVLTLCDDVIMTVGTFGWWAGWLAGGTTIYWKEYPKPKSSIALHFNHIDYYPKEWIGMTA